MRDGLAVKIRKIGPLLVAGAGATSRCSAFMDWVKAGMKGHSPWYGKDDGNSMIVTPDRRIVVFGESGQWLVDNEFYAMGSGERFALGAMAHGACAAEAVQAAIRFDIYSGGPIRTVSQ